MGNESRRLRSNRRASIDGGLSREQVEQLVEDDPALVPTGPSAFQVEDAVLDPLEVEALLAGLAALLEQTEPVIPVRIDSPGRAGDLPPASKGVSYESDASSVGRPGRHPKLSPFAWLFPHHAGAGGPTRSEERR